MNNQKPIRVLLVEDNENDAYTIRYLLRRNTLKTYEVDWAPSYEDGRKKALDAAHDIAVFDYRLGAKNGIELLRECLEQGCRVPIIVLTGAENPEIDLEAAEAGAADYLDKTSLDTPRLERSIRYALEQAKTLEKLREAQRHLNMFMENVPAAIGIKDAQGRYLFANDTLQQMLGTTRENCLGKTDRELAPDEDLTEREKMETEVLRTGEPRQATEPVLHRTTERYWLASRFPMMPAEGEEPLIGLAAIDITERVIAENQLKQTTQLLDGVLTNLPVIAGRIDCGGNIVEIQGRGLQRFGLEPEAFLPVNAFERLPHFHKQIETALQGDKATFLLNGKFEEQSWFLEIHLFFDRAQGEGAIFFCHDITEQKLLEKELLRISEEEQQRIGRDLHDGLGQQLTGVALLARSLEGQLEKNDFPEAEQAQAITAHIQDAIAQTRALSRELCPIHLEKYGFRKALEGLSHNIAQLYGIKCEFTWSGEGGIPDIRSATHLYRIVQEAVNNARKHGRAREILIRLDLSPEGNRLTIRDNGNGFAPAKLDSPGMGLQLMQYRAGIVGGNLSVTSDPENGTIVECTFPALPAGEESADEPGNGSAPSGDPLPVDSPTKTEK